ncbi:hypothetical protein BCR42DRAFT_470656 [Absidia repens]|uniref:PH domain-containing protein n=1 Tax=Absidia repens TaxID=90262 RepID=A0A1X2I4R1_9FUNG|nr:hypothetical protein BCR42DRAFT_470656 [Absidia repens]
MDIVYVVHQFDAENEDELSLCIGDSVMVLERDDGFEDGWWKGRNKAGQQGLFPVNYTSAEPPNSTTINSDDDNDNDNGNDEKLTEDDGMTNPSILSPNITFVSKNLQKAVRATLLSTTLSHIPPEQWQVEQVAEWLTQLGFDTAVHHFIEQEITGDILLELSLSSLKELEINTFGKRFKIHSAILALREEIFRQDPFYLHPSKSCLSTTEYYSPPHSPHSHGIHSSFDNEKHHLALSGRSSSFDNPQYHLHQSNQHARMESSDSQEDCVAPDMEGWLYKQGDKYKTWNKRWFVLKGNNLFYFKSPKDVRMKGIINLRGYRMVCDETICVGQYSFKAQHEKERTFYFYADSDLSMKAWIQSLIKATISRDFTAPVVSSSTIPTVTLDMARRMNPRPPSSLLYLNNSAKSTTSTKSNQFPSSSISTPPLMISSLSDSTDTSSSNASSIYSVDDVETPT